MSCVRWWPRAPAEPTAVPSGNSISEGRQPRASSVDVRAAGGEEHGILAGVPGRPGSAPAAVSRGSDRSVGAQADAVQIQRIQGRTRFSERRVGAVRHDSTTSAPSPPFRIRAGSIPTIVVSGGRADSPCPGGPRHRCAIGERHRADPYRRGQSAPQQPCSRRAPSYSRSEPLFPAGERTVGLERSRTARTMSCHRSP